MRGKVGFVSAEVEQQRITPAHAGKSPRSANKSLYAQDHPRPCGEKARLISPAHLKIGSPPPMRGKVSRLNPRAIAPRITPAHAGKSPLMGTSKLITQDHPRPCGEKRADGAKRCR